MNELAFKPSNDTRIRELALFAGAGGGILGTRLLGFRVVCAVEINPYYREVLLRRQEEGILSPFPIWDDVRTFDGREWRGTVDVITGGFPCQGYSVAGKQLGEHDERNLWSDTIRIIREVRPRWVLLENVPNLLTFGYFGTILSDLSESGYDARWKVISAAEVGAPHLRNRVWIVANAVNNTDKWWGGKGTEEDRIQSNNRASVCSRQFSRTGDVANTKGRQPREQTKHEGWQDTSRGSQEMADTTDKRLQRLRQLFSSPGEVKACSQCWWAVEPELG